MTESRLLKILTLFSAVSKNIPLTKGDRFTEGEPGGFNSSDNFTYTYNTLNLQKLVKVGIDADIAQKIIHEKQDFKSEILEKKLTEKNIQIITLLDSDYPLPLREISNPPPILYVLGNKTLLNSISLAIVGTRAISRYGQQVIQNILPQLVSNGITITSGLALGIDAYAHQTTVELKGKTIAVLGSGVDKILPNQNIPLARKILESDGAIISEFPLGTDATPYTFPIRNRVISGLSRGTLVIEAKEKSGSLITAQLALEQNRDVFAIPGDITKLNSGGTNKLISRGEAKLVTCPEDILNELGMVENTVTVAQTAQDLSFNSEIEQRIYSLLATGEELSLDHIIRETNLPTHEVIGTLTLLEMRTLAKNLGGGMWGK